MKYILQARDLKFKGDATKIPHYHFEQAQRLCEGNGALGTGNVKCVLCDTHEQGEKVLCALVGQMLKSWFGWSSGHFKASDFSFTINFTEVPPDGVFWLIPCTSYCGSHTPKIP